MVEKTSLWSLGGNSIQMATSDNVPLVCKQLMGNGEPRKSVEPLRGGRQEDLKTTHKMQGTLGRIRLSKQCA